MSNSLPVRGALAALSLSILMPSLDTSIANAGLPALAAAFNASFRHAQWIVLAYLLATTTLIVVAGRLGDLFGRRRVLLTGVAVFTAASFLCGVAPTLPTLIAARALQGLGAAGMLALAVALAGDTVPTGRTGRAMGLLGSMSAVGTTLGPSLGGVLMAGFGWRAMFLVNVPVGLLTMALAQRYLAAGRRTEHAEDLSAANAGAGFIRAGLFRDPVLGAGLAMSVVVSMVMMGTLVVGPFYLVRTLGLATVSVGLVLSIGPLVTALTGVPAGRLVDRFGATIIALLGLAGIACGASVLSMLPAGFGVVGYVAPIALMTSSYALFQAANNTAIMTAAGAARRGVVAGMLSLARNLGLIAGASLMGAVFARASASADISTAPPAAVAAGMHFTFAVAATLIVLALAGAAGSRPLVSRQSQ